MQVPWFFATTPAPRLFTGLTRRAAPPRWWVRVSGRYIAWAERSHDALRGSRAVG